MIKAVLFDFDGTVADTAPDLGHALNRQRIARGMVPLPIEQIRTEASAGARGLLGLAFNIKPGDTGYDLMREEFLDFYSGQLCHDTCLFPAWPSFWTTWMHAVCPGASSPTNRRVSPTR